MSVDGLTCSRGTSLELRVQVESPLANGSSEIRVRDIGPQSGIPVVHLHGGWGYEMYPIDPQIAAMPDVRFLIPDRTGYGHSTPIASLPPRFHHAAAIETERVLDALGLGRAILWGHSDGAVIAALLGLRDPPRYRGIVLEALHHDREKPGSREFFTTMAVDPDRFGSRVTAILQRDHGDRWREPLQMDGRAWLAIAESPEGDLFDGRLATLAVPTLVLHGSNDPRTEPGELETIRRELPHASVALIEHGGHCPHSHPRVASIATEFLARFTSRLPM